MKEILKSRMTSIGHAWNGIISFIKSEPNARIHLAATLIVIILGFIRNVSKHDWGFLIVAIGLVWIAEGINTAIEKLCNKVSPEYNALIKQVKDISAGVVLLASIVATILGCLVFLC